MDAKELFGHVLDQAQDVMHWVKPKDYSLPTPCEDWDMRQLLEHMMYELSWIEDVLAGKTIADVGSMYDGNLIGEDLAASWRAASQKARSAVGEANLGAVAHLSYGDTRIEDYIREVAGDLYIHTWDVSKALAYPILFDEAVARAIYITAEPKLDGFIRMGLVKESIPTEATDHIQTKLLALFGRRR